MRVTCTVWVTTKAPSKSNFLSMRVFQQPAYTLLNRPYSETSWITEVFTRDYGRVGLMAKGARRLKSKLKGALQPFQPILVSWVGKGEVPTLTSAEIDLSGFNLFEKDLRGDALVCGFYCNELLVNLLHRYDPHQALFETYNETISALYGVGAKAKIADTLRGFEQSVMKETGYEVSFLTESDGKTLIDDHAFYRFQVGEGFIRLAKQQANSVVGRTIKSLHGIVGDESQDSSQAKLLMREVLAQTLGKKKIVSRDLFFPRGHQD